MGILASDVLPRARARWPHLHVSKVKRTGRILKFLVQCFECQAKHWMSYNCSGRCFSCGNVLRAQKRATTMAHRIQKVVHQLVRNKRVSLPWTPKSSGYVCVPKDGKTHRL